MTEKRFTKYVPDSYGYTYITTIIDNEKNKQTGNTDEIVDMLNELADENEQLKLELDTHKHPLWSTREAERIVNELKQENEQLKSENDSYKNMFFEIVETALTDTNCKELYCKGILDIFDKANSLNQAREMIKEHLK